MPLPPALAARLAKRGIISKKAASQQSKPDEEVFAESYDDHDQDSIKTKSNLITNEEALEKIKFMGYSCCPNKWNVYHECAPWCQNRWSSRRSSGPDPDSEYAKIHKTMMEKYGPLPEHWQEKWDPGTGRHFYWCTRTDKVSWLPPGHPKAKITEAASHVREMIQNQIHMEPDQDFDDDDDDDDEDEDSDEHAMDLDSDMESDHEEEERRQREKERRREEKRKEKKTKFREAGTLDPMDPSSYSECPRYALIRFFVKPTQYILMQMIFRRYV